MRRDAAKGGFVAGWSDGAIVSLRRAADAWPTEYIAPDRALGHVLLRFREAGSAPWTAWCSVSQAPECVVAETQEAALFQGEYHTSIGAAHLRVTVRYELRAERLGWRIEIASLGSGAVEIGDLALPLPMNGEFTWDAEETATRRVLQHSFVSGHGSFLFWMRPNAAPPYLALLPDPDTAPEYWFVEGGEGHPVPWRCYHLYLHSKASEEAIAQNKGSWRQPHTSAMLQPGETRTWGFALHWADGYSAIRDLLYEQGLPDVHVVPGMTVPENLDARIAVRVRSPELRLEAESPNQTVIEELPPAGGGFRLFRAAFRRLGENRLTLRFGKEHHQFLEFFVTEPVETLIRKRAAFLATACRHRDPNVWWRGLISDWNMETGVLLGPEHLDRIHGWREYMASCDDPGLGKPAFLAAKNAEYPRAEEVETLNDYIDHFVWGGLQMTDEEPHPFAIYGIPNWKRNRESDDPGPKGRLHVWRIYDYPHVVLLYYSMYRIARRCPHLRTTHSAREYLRRAAGTALALFTVPKAIRDWSAYGTGLYNELVIVPLIASLAEEGMLAEAAALRRHWEQKARTFVAERPNLFASEYSFDSTGFESMHVLAKYALEQMDLAGDAAPFTREQAAQFMRRAIEANLCCRGWLENAYYLLGSDLRGSGAAAYTLSYMSQMGGWAILDYGLYYAEDPYPYLRLGYASFLSSWALMNTGRPETNYGAWYPGPQNDGAAGGGFEPAAYGKTWLDQPHGRGSWYYACEIDLGFSGGLRCARTILADDPLFGLTCYGGDVRLVEGGFEVLPKDGLFQRFHAMIGSLRLHVALERDGFCPATPIRLARDGTRVDLVVRSRVPGDHTARLEISGLPAGVYHLRVNGELLALGASDPRQPLAIDIPVRGASAAVELRRVSP